MRGLQFQPGTWTEQFPEIRVPAAKMIGSSSRFTNIYRVQPETILLEEETIAAQVATIRLGHGATKSLAYYTDDPAESRQGTIGAKIRTAVETMLDGPILKMGNRLVFDARRVYNGNVAHIIGHHLARLGYAKAKLGVDRGDCLVILEKNSPKISHELFDLVGYETCETNRPVEGNVLEIDVKRYEPYHLAQYVANVEPPTLQRSGLEKIFIPRRSSRRLINEKEIVAIAAGRGYTTCYFEDIPLREQWVLVRDARSIIGIHGAALAYLSTKGKPGIATRYQLLEILSPGLVVDGFRKTSAVLGGQWIGCRGRLSSGFVRYVDEKPNFKSQEAKDFYLHPEAFEKALSVSEFSAA